MSSLSTWILNNSLEDLSVANQLRKHGGKRTAGPGKRMGRPPVENPKVAISARVTSEVAAYLRSCENASCLIDSVIRRTRAFRDRG